MPLFGQSSPKPSSPWSKPPAAPPQKPSWGLFESLGFKSSPKKEVGAQPAKPPGLFGDKGYSSFKDQKWFATKAPDKPLPGTGQNLFKEGRIKIVEEIEKYAKEAGQPYGLSGQSWKTVVKPYMEKKAYELGIRGKVVEAQELRRRMQQYENWGNE